MSELVVLLDEDGHAVGTMPKADVHHRATPLHLAFSVYVLDDDERLLVTQRAHHKKTWPGVWTNSCCGHPAPGEALTTAVRRRVGQELGLDLDEPRVALPAFRYRAVMDDGTVENEMCPVLVARCPTPTGLRADPGEVAEAVWEPWSAFRDEVLAGQRPVSPWCRSQVAQLPAHPLTDHAIAPGELPAALR